jgi:DNA-binding CsgD family transcriptional regulator
MMKRNMTEWQVRALLAGIGVGSFGLLMSLEVMTETDGFQLVDFLVDALTLLLMISTTLGLVLLFHRMQSQHEERVGLIERLDIARAEGAEWRQKAETHLAGLRAEMENQFDRWGMSPAEKDVGMLILKGLSHKEIGSLRGTTEATVRQQAQSIYQKSDLPGKTAFSAYFLEDLIASDPGQPTTAPLKKAS